MPRRRSAFRLRLHYHLADHAGLEMTRNEAGEVHLPHLGEASRHLTRLPRPHMVVIRFLVPGVRMLPHVLGVLFQLRHRAEHDLVHHLALVRRHEPDDLAPLHPDLGRRKAHVVAHVDAHRALGRGGAHETDQAHQEDAHSLTLRRRSALLTTETELIAIAAPAKIGESRMPKNGYNAPAATGTPRAL